MTTGANAYFATDGTLGIKFTETTTDAKFELGTIKHGTHDTEWIYVKATVACVLGTMVVVDGAGVAALATAAVAAKGKRIGFCQNAFAADDYGWVAIRGDRLTAAVSGTAVPDVQLYAATTGGALSTTATAGTLEGVNLLTGVSTTAAIATATLVATWPHFKSL